jgi:hypothetical protein
VSLRRTLVSAATGLFIVVLLWRDDPASLRARGVTLFRTSGLDLATRRLNGTAVGFDRQFFVFLESARRNLPPGTRGVAVSGVPASDPARYLTAYHLAPIPALLDPERVPPGWMLAVYGADRPLGWKVVTPIWRGVLMTPGT